MYLTTEASCHTFRALLDNASTEVVNGQTSRGATALMLAASRGNKPLVEMLLADRRVNVNIVDFGSPPKSAVDRCSRSNAEIQQLIMDARGGKYVGAS